MIFCKKKYLLCPRNIKYPGAAILHSSELREPFIACSVNMETAARGDREAAVCCMRDFNDYSIDYSMDYSLLNGPIMTCIVNMETAAYIDGDCSMDRWRMQHEYI